MEIKQKIIEQINSIEDRSILEEIYRLISYRKNIERIYEFSEDELSQVKEALGDADSNRYYTQRESENLITEWLHEKSVY